MNSCNNFRDQRELNRDYREEGPYKRQRFNSHSVSPRPSKNYGEKQAKFLDNRPNHRKRNESPLNEAQEWSKPDYRNSRNPKNDGKQKRLGTYKQQMAAKDNRMVKQVRVFSFL